MASRHELPDCFLWLCGCCAALWDAVKGLWAVPCSLHAALVENQFSLLWHCFAVGWTWHGHPYAGGNLFCSGCTLAEAKCSSRGIWVLFSHKANAMTLPSGVSRARALCCLHPVQTSRLMSILMPCCRRKATCPARFLLYRGAKRRQVTKHALCLPRTSCSPSSDFKQTRACRRIQFSSFLQRPLELLRLSFEETQTPGLEPPGLKWQSLQDST